MTNVQKFKTSMVSSNQGQQAAYLRLKNKSFQAVENFFPFLLGQISVRQILQPEMIGNTCFNRSNIQRAVSLKNIALLLLGGAEVLCSGVSDVIDNKLHFDVF